MGVVLEAMFGLAVVVGLTWLWSLRGSVVKDVQASQEAQQEAARRQERDAREARLYRPGEPLRCLGCGACFAGPMGDAGCPQCRLAALVVTESDYERGQQASASRGEGG